MSFLQTVQNPMCIRINHVILLKKCIMYNCVQTNMLEFHPTDFLDQDHDNRGAMNTITTFTNY